MNKICIYTCIIGEYDYLITPKYIRDDVDYVCYTDQNIKSEIWEIRSIPDDICNLDKKIQNKWIKMHPHIILSNYDITIFVDANIFIKDDICSLIDYIINIGHEVDKALPKDYSINEHLNREND